MSARQLPLRRYRKDITSAQEEIYKSRKGDALPTSWQIESGHVDNAAARKIHVIDVIDRHIEYCAGRFACKRNGSTCIQHDDLRNRHPVTVYGSSLTRISRWLPPARREKLTDWLYFNAI